MLLDCQGREDSGIGFGGSVRVYRACQTRRRSRLQSKLCLQEQGVMNIAMEVVVTAAFDVALRARLLPLPSSSLPLCRASYP
jgi:hypothetical protein